jgi:hypothetical protein
MKKQLFLLLSVWLFFSHSTFGFTVVLKSGKKIEGTWIDENRTTIRIRDQQGTVLVFKKSTLDSAAMSLASRMQSSPATQTPNDSLTVSESIAPSEVSGSSPLITPPKPPQQVSLAAKERLWSLNFLLSNAYDTNINHDPEKVHSYGLIYGAEVTYRTSKEHPALELDYEIAQNSYTNTDQWDRISNDFVATYQKRLSKPVTFEINGELNFKGSSEDRELSNQYIVEPHLNYRFTRITRVDFYGAYRIKRYDDITKNSRNKYVGIDFQQSFNKSQLIAGIRYERNDADGERNSYIRWTYGASFSAPFAERNVFETELRYRPQRYGHRLIKVDDSVEVRDDHRWVFVVSVQLAIAGHLDLIPGYRFETRSSNDPDKLFTEHLPLLTLRYNW